MANILNELSSELKTRGADFIRTIDISMLSEDENHGYKAALLIGIVLSPEYIFHLSKENVTDFSEFNEKEVRGDKLAEWAADYFISKGYIAYAQSENNVDLHGFYDEKTKTTPLPHKKIAVLSGLGWIGKNNLLVTQKYGCALCMSTVLTNAPLPAQNKKVITPKCGECTVCQNICPVNAIHGCTWGLDTDRDILVDVYCCEACLKCLINCPQTQQYMNNNLTIQNQK